MPPDPDKLNHAMRNATPAQRGESDSYYRRYPATPHKVVDGRRVTELTREEHNAYHQAFTNNQDFKDWT